MPTTLIIMDRPTTTHSIGIGLITIHGSTGAVRGAGVGADCIGASTVATMVGDMCITMTLAIITHTTTIITSTMVGITKDITSTDQTEATVDLPATVIMYQA